MYLPCFCNAGHAEVVKLLVKAHALVDKANQKGTTALMRATQEGNEEVVRILVSAGADVSKRNNERMNALMLGSQVTSRLRGGVHGSGLVPQSSRRDKSSSCPCTWMLSMRFPTFLFCCRIELAVQRQWAVVH